MSERKPSPAQIPVQVNSNNSRRMSTLARGPNYHDASRNLTLSDTLVGLLWEGGIIVTRRQAIGTLLSGAVCRSQEDTQSRQATGVKVGEVTPDSAVIWARRTTSANRLADGILRRGAGKNARAPAPGEDVNRFEGACPGGSGYMRLIVEPVASRGRKRTFDWVEVNPDRDYTQQFRLSGLES